MLHHTFVGILKMRRSIEISTRPKWRS